MGPGPDHLPGAGRDGTGAQLGLDLLREAKVKDDGFVALVLRALGSDSKLPDALPSPQPMALALLEKSSLAVPKKAFDSARLPVLVAVANGSGFPAEQRVLAAEKAASLGALGARCAGGSLSGDRRLTKRI